MVILLVLVTFVSPPFTFIKKILLVDGLKLNLFSINPLCDNASKVVSESPMCIVSSLNHNGILFIGYKYKNIYIVDLEDFSMKDGQYLVAIKTKVKEIS